MDLELVLAADISNSIDAEEALLQRRGYIEALLNQSVVDAIQAGPLGCIALTYVEWADRDHQRVVSGWRLISDLATARAVAHEIAEASTQRGQSTAIGAAIDFSVTQFDNNGFDGRRRVIDISGDGTSSEGQPVTLARDVAVASGITINGLPILRGKVPPGLARYYERNVIGGPGAFHIVATDFSDFAHAVLQKLVLEIAGGDPAIGKTLPLVSETARGRAP
ncbi:MAG TPA: DUF1194 domain-containing protein [Inquilinus sp.]